MKKLTKRLLITVILINMCNSIVTAQTNTDLLPDSKFTNEESLRPEELYLDLKKPLETAEVKQWLDQLKDARLKGDYLLAGALQRNIDRHYGFGEAVNVDIPVDQPQSQPVISSKDEPLSDWFGSDISVYTGELRRDGHRQIALTKDDDGHLYTLVNTTLTNSKSLLFKSTNQGLTWTNIASVTYGTHFAQAVSLSCIDSGSMNRIGAVITYGTQSMPTYDASVWFISWRADGSRLQSYLIQGTTTGFGFRNPSVTNDGFYYAISNTSIYAAYEQVNSSGVSIGIYAARSTNFGSSWTTAVTTIFNDHFPVISNKHSSVGVDSIYIVCCREFSSTDKQIRIIKQNVSNIGSFPWREIPITNSGRNENISFSIRHAYTGSPNENQMMITYAHNDSGRYAYSLNQGTTFMTNNTLAFDDENPVTFTSCVLDSQVAGNNYAKAVFISNGDSVIYRGGILGSLGERLKMNNNINTTAVSPCVSSYRIGSYTNGAIIYAGSGPNSVFYDGESFLTGVNPPANVIPEKFSLSQNYPNPFNPKTIINFQLSMINDVKLRVYDIKGSEVTVLVNKKLEAGAYQVEFNGDNFPSGVYLYTLKAGNSIETKKMLLVK